MKNNKRKFLVTFKEIDQNTIYIEIMDNKTLSYLSLDWAFKIISIKEI